MTASPQWGASHALPGSNPSGLRQWTFMWDYRTSAVADSFSAIALLLHREQIPPFLWAERCKLDEPGGWYLTNPSGFQRLLLRLAEPKEHDPNHDTVGLRRSAWSAARVRGGIGEATDDVGRIYTTSVEREN